MPNRGISRSLSQNTSCFQDKKGAIVKHKTAPTVNPRERIINRPPGPTSIPSDTRKAAFVQYGSGTSAPWEPSHSAGGFDGGRQKEGTLWNKLNGASIASRSPTILPSLNPYPMPPVHFYNPRYFFK